MHKAILPIMAAGTLALGGCAGGYGPGGILGSVLGGLGGSGYDNRDFERAAVDACGSEASRYGRVGISNVSQVGANTLRVQGVIDDGRQRRGFVCDFRSDGRITGFDIR